MRGGGESTETPPDRGSLGLLSSSSRSGSCNSFSVLRQLSDESQNSNSNSNGIGFDSKREKNEPRCRVDASPLGGNIKKKSSSSRRRINGSLPEKVNITVKRGNSSNVPKKRNAKVKTKAKAKSKRLKPLQTSFPEDAGGEVLGVGAANNASARPYTSSSSSATPEITRRTLFGTPMQYESGTGNESAAASETDEYEVPPETPSTFMDSNITSVPDVSFSRLFAHNMGFRQPPSAPHDQWADDNTDVFKFLRVPINVERLVNYGFVMCIDTALFVFTMLPIRIFVALGLLALAFVAKSAAWIGARVPLLKIPCDFASRVCRLSTSSFRRTQLYDLLRGALIAVTLYALMQFPLSRVYHQIRGQTFIKLYVIFNILDIFDKLLCAAGQDIMDGLFWATRSADGAILRVSVRWIMAVCYTILHATLYFTRLVTLTVAVNSSNNVLLTILISNNFVELKSSVFKRFAPANLLQICCSDIVERFELFSFLLLTAMQTQNWDQFLRNSTYMVCVELVVDWVKHSFITKFNNHSAALYEDYMEILSRDVAFSTFVDLLSQHIGSPSRLTPTNKASATAAYTASKPIVDPTQTIARRVGLACIPISCVILRFLWVDITKLFRNENTLEGIAIVVLVFCCLVALKTLLNVTLLVKACDHLLKCDEEDKRKRRKSAAGDGGITPREARLGELASIQRYTLFKSRIPTH